MKKIVTLLFLCAIVTAGYAQTAVDTNGLYGWSKQYNSYQNWEIGAFNQTVNPNDPTDFGWGNYDFTTHFITGDSMYIVKTQGGNYRQLAVEQLASGVWSFKTADLDGSNEVIETIDRNNYPNRNFVYYSIDSGDKLDLEGDNTKWDLKFTTYLEDLGIMYGVSGVLSNRNVMVSEVVYNVGGSSTIADTINFPFHSEINTIGYDWKKYDFGAGGYVYNDTTDYYVEDLNGNHYKLRFVEYGGSATGDMKFTIDGDTQLVSLGAGNTEQVYYDLSTKTAVHTNQDNAWDLAFFTVPGTTYAPIRLNDVGGAELYTYPKTDIDSWDAVGIEDKALSQVLSIYPNPASDFINVVVENKVSTQLNISIMDLNGRVVYNEVSQNGIGLQNITLNISDLNAGIYLVSVEEGSKKSVQRIVIQ